VSIRSPIPERAKVENVACPGAQPSSLLYYGMRIEYRDPGVPCIVVLAASLNLQSSVLSFYSPLRFIERILLVV
jgi:hypothetical protein